MKINGKRALCEGGEYFFREVKYVYIYACEKNISQTDCGFFSMIDSLRLPSRTLRVVLFTTRRLFRRVP